MGYTITYNGMKYSQDIQTDPETTNGSAISLNEDTAQEVDKDSGDYLLNSISNTLESLNTSSANFFNGIENGVSTIKSVISSLGNIFVNYWQLLLVGVVAFFIIRRR